MDDFTQYHLLRRVLRNVGIDDHKTEDIEKKLKDLQYKANRKVQRKQLQVRDVQDFLLAGGRKPGESDDYFHLTWIRHISGTEVLVITDDIVHAVQRMERHVKPQGHSIRREHIIKQYYYRIYEEENLLWHHEDQPYSVPAFYYKGWGTQALYRKDYMYDNILSIKDK